MAPDTAEDSAADAAGESLVVECATCSVQYPWNELAEGRRILYCQEVKSQEGLTSFTPSIMMTDE